MPCLPNDFPGAVTTVPVLKNFMSLETEDVVAEEVPVALVYNGISHTVMMASPGVRHRLQPHRRHRRVRLGHLRRRGD